MATCLATAPARPTDCPPAERTEQACAGHPACASCYEFCNIAAQGAADGLAAAPAPRGWPMPCEIDVTAVARWRTIAPRAATTTSARAPGGRFAVGIAPSAES